MKKQIILDGIIFDYYIYDDGRCQNLKTNKFLKGSINKSNGYFHYYLRKDGIAKNIGAHRLVAIMFLDNPNNYKIVHHKNHNKLDNNVNNLEWVSESQNSKERDFSKCRNKRPRYQYYTEDLPNEEWRFYHNTHFKFSNYGRLLNTKTNRLLICHTGYDGYCYYSPVIDGKTKKIMAHRGVYESFYDVYLDKQEQIDHIDMDKSNNKLENLRKVSPQENCYYRSRNIVEKYDYCIGQYDLNEQLIATYSCLADAEKETGISMSSISLVIKGKNKTAKGFIWKKLPKCSTTIGDECSRVEQKLEMGNLSKEEDIV